MDLKQQILHYYRVDEMSLREIARRTGADRKTVTRLIDAYEAAIKSDPDMGIDEFLATRPKYTSRKYAPRVMRDAVAKEIERCLKENDRRRGNGMRKQCLKNTDIHRQLMEKGLTVSYSGVCKYVRKKKNERSSKGKDVYLRIHREPGIECEFDWGEVKLFLDGVPTTLMMAVFCFPYSKGRMAYLFHRQDTLAYMESHRDFFRDCAGVPHVMVYDNMRVAVVFDDKEKKPTTALMRLSTFYKFEWRFCNARSGWEKGNVERSVDYVRGRAFTSRVDFDDIEEARNWLRQVCIDMNAEIGSSATENKPRMLEEEIKLGTKARMARKQPPLEHYGPSRLVRRGSTRLLPQADPRVQRALESIRRHVCERRLKIDDIAKEMGCSRRLATLRFRQTTGRSILDEIHAQRLARICDLLANTSWPISTVIAQSGYVSESFAHKLFRSHTGLTMRAWRMRSHAPIP